MTVLCSERESAGSPRPPAATAGRPPWLREIALIALGYLLYTVTRNAAPLHLAAAQHHATALYRLERWLHLDVELNLNHLLSQHAAAEVFASYYYATLHFVVTLGVLVWAYRRHPEAYRRVRTVIVLSTVAALYLFWAFPLAPPRLTGFGFVDTISSVRLWGGATWNSKGVADVSNEYAAMPSLHVAWSLWSAAVVMWLARGRTVRMLAPLYPLVTLTVVIATANHFVLDAAGAVGILLFALVIQALADRPLVRQRAAALTEVISEALLRRLGLGPALQFGDHDRHLVEQLPHEEAESPDPGRQSIPGSCVQVAAPARRLRG